MKIEISNRVKKNVFAGNYYMDINLLETMFTKSSCIIKICLNIMLLCTL